MPRQIGWSQESNLLYNISQQLDRLAAVTAASGGGGGGTITGVGANGQLTFWDAATNITGSNNLVWDNTNRNLTVSGSTYSVGTYWKTIPGTNFPVGNFRGIAYGNGLFVAIADVGAGGTSTTTSVATSPDGVNWTYRTLPAAAALTNIIYQNGIFVAVGRTGTQRGFYSYDGVNWFTTTVLNGILFGITYGKDKFVACKIDNSLARISISYDGKNWQNSTTPASMDLPFTGVAYGNDIYVAVAESNSSASIATSNDGITWTSGTRPSGGTVTTYNICYGNGLFVVTCNLGKIMTSPDGVTWTQRDTPLTGLIWKCIYAEGVFIAAGAFSTTQNKFIYSTDGITWKEANTPALNNWGGFAYGNGMLLAVSYGGPDTSALIVKSGELNSFIPQNDNITHGKQTYTDDVVLTRTNRLGIGTNTPTSQLTVTGPSGGQGQIALNSAARPNGLVFNWFDAGNVGEIHYYAETRFRQNATGLNLVLTSGGNVVLGGNVDGGNRLTVGGNTNLNGDVSISGKLALTVVTNRQTVNYSLVLADNGKLVEMNVGAANTLTVPPNSSIAFPIGTKIDIAQYGAGQTSIVPGVGVTVRSALGALKLAAQYSGASLVKIGTDEWYLFGDITV